MKIRNYGYVMRAGLVGKSQSVILTAFFKNPRSTDREISEKIGVKINSVTARRNELVQMGCLVAANSRPCKITGKMSKLWAVPQVIKYVPLRLVKRPVCSKCKRIIKKRNPYDI
jgi:hypothetical protein